jgi:hypothetical protein
MPLPRADPKTPLTITICCVFLVLALFLLVRGAMLGVVVRADRVVVRTWLRTWSFERGTGVIVGLDYWSGLMTQGFTGWPFRILTFTPVEGLFVARAQATIALRRVNAPVARLLAHLLENAETEQSAGEDQNRRVQALE